MATAPAIALAMADAAGATERVLEAVTRIQEIAVRPLWLTGAHTLVVVAWVACVAAVAWERIRVVGWAGVVAGLLATPAWVWMAVWGVEPLRSGSLGLPPDDVAKMVLAMQLMCVSYVSTAASLAVLSGLAASRRSSVLSCGVGLMAVGLTATAHAAAILGTAAAMQVVWGTAWAGSAREVSLLVHAVLVPLGLLAVVVALGPHPVRAVRRG